MVILLIGIAYITFYSYESLPNEQIQCDCIAISDVKGFSEKEIVNTILTKKFDHYKYKKLFTKNKVFDYKINRINGPIKNSGELDKSYYDVSYSVKTIDPTWIAGNGNSEGLWINNKSEFYILIKDNNRYVLKYIGGL